jgi:NADPH2:quinone reductase
MSAFSPGVFLGAELATDRVRNNIQRLACSELGVLIDRSFPLAVASSAHAYIESRQAVGRVLLIP